MNCQHDRVASALYEGHVVRQHVARDRLRYVFHQLAAKSRYVTPLVIELVYAMKFYFSVFKARTGVA